MASSSSATSGDDRPPSGGSASGIPPQAHAEWATSMQAYYAAAAGGDHPYAAWPAPQQHGLMAAGPGAGAAYGTSVPFPTYHHPAAYYAHAPMPAGAPYVAGEAASAVAKGKSKRKTRRAPSGEGASGSGSGDDRRHGSSEKRCAGADQKGSSSAKRRKYGAANAEGGENEGWHFSGEPARASTTQNALTEPRFVAKGRPASKLSVSAPGRAALPNATPNLNIGMDLWSVSPSAVMPSGQGEVNAGASSQSNGSLSQMDERELKKERRKQSNRESARRSRLRKQQECEELAQKVTDLTTINGALRSELDHLKKDCEDMEAENTQLMDEILTHDDERLQSEGPSVLTTLSIQVDACKAHHGRNGKLRKNTNNDSKV